MKKCWIISFFMFCVSHADAQFHNVSNSKTLYAINKVVADTNPFDCSEVEPDNKKAASCIETGKRQVEGHAIWIDRYLSVSYPLDKIIVNSRFGIRKDPFTGKKRKHNGLDLQAKNEKVYAMMVGEVIKVSSDKSSGKYVTIRHGGYTVSYCHLSEVWVKKGMKVMPGEIVAVSGNSGRSTGPHLHISVQFDKQYIDPDILLRFVHETRQEAWERLIKE